MVDDAGVRAARANRARHCACPLFHPRNAAPRNVGGGQPQAPTRNCGTCASLAHVFRLFRVAVIAPSPPLCTRRPVLRTAISGRGVVDVSDGDPRGCRRAAGLGARVRAGRTVTSAPASCCCGGAAFQHRHRREPSTHAAAHPRLACAACVWHRCAGAARPTARVPRLMQRAPRPAPHHNHAGAPPRRRCCRCRHAARHSGQHNGPVPQGAAARAQRKARGEARVTARLPPLPRT